MSNPRVHYFLMCKMQAKMAIDYVHAHKHTYPASFKSQLKTDVALLKGMLVHNTDHYDIEHQTKNMVDVCIFAEEERDKQ